MLSNDTVDVSECLSPLVALDPYHKALIITVKYTKFSPLKQAAFKKYFYSSSDYESINKDILDIDWDNEISSWKFSEAINFFYVTYKQLGEKYIPHKIIKPDFYPKWYSLPLKKAIKEKAKYHRKFKLYGNRSTYNSFIFQRDRVRDLQDQCFQRFLRSTEDAIHSDPKRFWSFLKSRSNSKSIPSSMNFNGGQLNTGTDICIAFSTYFNSNFLRVTTSSDSLDPNVPSMPDSCCDISSIEVNPDLLTHLLLKLDPSKSAGPDDLPAQFLIRCAKSISKPVFLLFQRCFRECVVLSVWKTAFISPVNKKGSKTDISNYRPISKLCIPLKCLKNSFIFKFITL